MQPSPWSQPPPGPRPPGPTEPGATGSGPTGPGLPDPAPSPSGQPLPPPNPAAAVPATPAAPAPQSTGIPAGAWVLLGAALAAVLGALLPWVRARAGPISIDRAGTEVDGAITLFLGVVLGAIALAAIVITSRRTRSLALGIAAIVVAGLVLLIAIVDIADVNDKAVNIEGGGITIEVSVGSGLWLTLVAGLAGILGGALLLIRRR